MSPGRIAAGRAGATKAGIALLAGSACLVAVAHAATGGGGREIGVAGSHVAVGASHPGNSPQSPGERAPGVRLIEVPQAGSTATDPQFRFHVPPRDKKTEQPSRPTAPAVSTPRRRFQCKLDGGRWIVCTSPYRLIGLAPGEHAFAVHALSRDDRLGPDVVYRWQVVEPGPPTAGGKPFSIEQTAALAPLYPGDPAQPVPLAIGNPNPVPIEVTSLSAAIGDAPGCAAGNFELGASNVSAEAPLVVPAEGTVELPSAGISPPSIALLDLPVDQDACQGVELELALSGEARG
jgi:hypothetical protein